MKRLRAIALNLADRANPIVVKELRQAVQSRLVGAILLVFLLANLAVVASYLLLNADAATSPTAGQSIFEILFVILVATCMIFVPLYAGIRLTTERNDSNIDLLFVTTISPAIIIRGKFLAALALTVLIYSACMPFLALTFLLRGIDLPSIFFSLAVGLFCTAGVIMIAIFAGSIFGGWLLRLLLAFGLLFVMYMAIAGTIAFCLSTVTRGLSYLFDSSESWFNLVIGASAYLSLGGLFYLLAVAALGAESSNRMFPLRVFMTATWAGFGIAFSLWGWSTARTEPIFAWTITSVSLFSAVLVIVLAERESWTPRVRRHIPRYTLLKLLAWIAYTGSAGGVIWCLAIILASLVVGWFSLGEPVFADFFARSGNEYPHGILFVFGVFLFAWCYSMTGLLARRIFAPKSTPLVGPTIGLALLAAGCTLPLLGAYLVQGENWSMEALPIAVRVFNPVVLYQQYSPDCPIAYLILIGWALLGWVANFSWFRGQWQAFRRYESLSHKPPLPPTVSHV